MEPKAIEILREATDGKLRFRELKDGKWVAEFDRNWHRILSRHTMERIMFPPDLFTQQIIRDLRAFPTGPDPIHPGKHIKYVRMGWRHKQIQDQDFKDRVGE